MKKQGKGKRKLKEYKEYIKKRKSYTSKDDEEKENSSKNKEDNNIQIYPRKGKVNKKQRKKNKNDSIIAASKVSYDYITKIMKNEIKTDKNEELNKIKESETDNSKSEYKKEEEDKSNKRKIDDIFLSTLYILFEEYDEIKIKKDNNKQYIIDALIKIENDKEIRFEIVYDNERDYFDYYPNNKNFDFKDEDEPFNYDLDIPKEDFCLLIRNFKKFKIK
jgi:hypothetical protein